jgi:hypothetical protein
MTPHTPARSLERFALLIVAAVASLSMMSGVFLVLNHEEQGALAYATGCVPTEASSTSANAPTAGCRP